MPWIKLQQITHPLLINPIWSSTIATNARLILLVTVLIVIATGCSSGGGGSDDDPNPAKSTSTLNIFASVSADGAAISQLSAKAFLGKDPATPAEFPMTVDTISTVATLTRHALTPGNYSIRIEFSYQSSLYGNWIIAVLNTSIELLPGVNDLAISEDNIEWNFPDEDNDGFNNLTELLEDTNPNEFNSNPNTKLSKIAYLRRPTRSLVDPAKVAAIPEALDVPMNNGLVAGNLFIRDISNPNAVEINITGELTAAVLSGSLAKSAGDVAGLEVSYDGTKLLFAMHQGVYEDDTIYSTWNIWEYDLAAPDNVNPLRRIIAADGFSNEGDDFDPHYLPDGRIVFTSNRQKGHTISNRNIGTGIYEKTSDESLNQLAYNLHVMDADGSSSSIHQISYNMSSDLNPTVLPDGRILFTRWDRLGNNKFSFYSLNADGTALRPMYGVHSTTHIDQNGTHQIAFTEARPMMDGRLLATLVPREGTHSSGDLISIDYDNFTDVDIKKFGSTIESEQGHKSLTNNEIELTNQPSRFGRYLTPYPIWEPDGGQRALVSWSVCRLKPVNEPDDLPEIDRERVPCTQSNLENPNYGAAPPFFGIYMYNIVENRKYQLILPENEDLALVNPVAIVTRPETQIPPVYIDKTVDNGELDPDLAHRLLGAINIKTVYDTQGTVPMVDSPLEPHGSSILTGVERSLIPMTTVTMDSVTGEPYFEGASPNPGINRQVADIAVIRDPVQRNANERVARFVRITKGVVNYSRFTLPTVNIGRTGGYRMREILGYKEIEPDGSVYMEIPANVPFTIQVLDVRGRALAAHDSWLQLVPGEVQVCNGCHSANDKQKSINPGAPNNSPFPNSVNSLLPEIGETMAETRKRQNCLVDCSYPKLTMDIKYADVWTDPSEAGRPPDSSVNYSYTDFYDYDPTSEVYDQISIPVENSLVNCESSWDWLSFFCRISINYADHIQPIWDRALYTDNGIADGMDTESRPACTSCHTDYVMDMGIPVAQVPAGDLNLNGSINPDTGRLISYDQLTARRALQVLDGMGNLVDKLARDSNGDLILDENGNPIPLVTASEIIAGVATSRQSPLIKKLTDPNLIISVDHTNLLLPGELRLIIEWDDIGNQYYNNPIDAPLNY